MPVNVVGGCMYVCMYDYIAVSIAVLVTTACSEAVHMGEHWWLAGCTACEINAYE